MRMRICFSPWSRLALGIAVLIGCGVATAQAGFPRLPFPPQEVSPEPPIFVPPIIDEPPLINNPPPVESVPEPATMVLGLIGSGIAGLAAYRRRRQLSRSAASGGQPKIGGWSRTSWFATSSESSVPASVQ